MHQITNQQRQQQPAVQVNPVGSGADVKIAEVIQGAFRHIEIQSESEVIRDHAMDLMVRTGKGAWRVVTDYVDDEGDEQDIYEAWIENIFALYSDPNAKLPDRSDKKWCFIVSDGVEVPLSKALSSSRRTISPLNHLVFVSATVVVGRLPNVPEIISLLFG